MTKQKLATSLKSMKIDDGWALKIDTAIVVITKVQFDESGNSDENVLHIAYDIVENESTEESIIEIAVKEYVKKSIGDRRMEVIGE